MSLDYTISTSWIKENLRECHENIQIFVKWKKEGGGIPYLLDSSPIQPPLYGRHLGALNCPLIQCHALSIYPFITVEWDHIVNCICYRYIALQLKTDQIFHIHTSPEIISLHSYLIIIIQSLDNCNLSCGICFIN